MKKRLIMILFVLIVPFILPVDTQAMTLDDVSNNVNILNKYDNEFINLEIGHFSAQNRLAGNCEGLLGNPKDEDSVAWLLQKILDYIKIIGPALVLVLSSIDFLKVVIFSDDDAMGKAKKKLGMRIILMMLLFFIPVIIEVLLNVFGVFSDPTCGLK